MSDAPDLHALIELRSLPRRFKTDQPTRVKLRVHNEGRDTWLAGGSTPVFASYHWRRPCGDYVIYDGRRSTLPRDVAPGESCDVSCEVWPPSAPGRYLLELDLVQETVSWFDELTVQLPCRVLRGTVPDYDFHSAWERADLDKDFWSISGPRTFEEFRDIAAHKIQILLARGLSPTSRILDVGCATGSLPTVLVDYLEPEGRYFGTDIVQKAIDFCRERYPQPNFRFAVNEPTGIPIRDETFDFITLFSVFTHMLPEDIEKLTASLAQVLAPGGQLVADAFVSDQIRGYRGSHTKADIEEAVLVRAFNRSGLEVASREQLGTDGDVLRVLFTLIPEGARDPSLDTQSTEC